MSFAESWKSLGNQAYQQGNFDLSIEHFTKAIDADPTNAVYYLNRSLSYASLKNWELSLKDAAISIKLDSKYVKGHFRYVKALLELELYTTARTALHIAIKECGEKDFRGLEDLIFEKTGIPLRPKSTDFEIICELGDGNFSKVYKTYLKKNKRIFAIKTIEKQTVERMKRRHPNIHNEMLMEKKALQKLSHPGIVQLFATFQDFGTLYYQMEYIGGNDLWISLHEILPDSDTKSSFQFDEGDEKRVPILNDSGEDENVPKMRGRTGAQIGVHWSLLRFYFAEIISAVEHMHQHGIVHRDIKPENIIITSNGHLKFVDFGTAKDMVQTDLNGQEFVGTPEYMSPGTVCVKNGGPPKNICTDAASSFSSNIEQSGHAESSLRLDGGIGIEADIWAMGVVLYQMVFGLTPFYAASPYLVFLRIKRDLLMLPEWLPSPISSMIRILLNKDSKSRMLGAIGQCIESFVTDVAVYSSISYDTLRKHDFFSKWDDAVTTPQKMHYLYCLRAKCGLVMENEVVGETQNFFDVSTVKEVYNSPACRIPSLYDLCIRAAADATVKVAFATADNGGIRPKIPWMQNFNLVKYLSQLDLGKVAHVLDRQQKLQIPGVHRLMHKSLPESRCKKANPSTKEYVGLNRATQGHFTTAFHFAQVSAPEIDDNDVSGGDRFRNLISNINKIRPKFFAVVGNFTNISVSDECLSSFNNAAEAFRKLVARVSDTIPVVFVPGPYEVGQIPTPSTLSNYRSLFGADYYSFWYQGMKGIVVNSSLLIDGANAPEEADLQSLWLEEEIEQAKLCASTIVLFTYHPWYYENIDEDDVEEFTERIRTIPKTLRQFWLKKMQHHKVKLIFSAGSYCDIKPELPFANSHNGHADDECSHVEADIKDALDSKDGTGDSDDDGDSFENIEDYSEGPELLGSCPTTQNDSGYRLMLVGENEIQHRIISCSNAPASMQDALRVFA